jgi:hypothetical protein
MASVFPDSTRVEADVDHGLNLMGNDNLTFTGTNFPHEMVFFFFEIHKQMHENAKCTVVDTKTDELVCLTSKFNTNNDVNKDLTLTVVINGLTVT